MTDWLLTEEEIIPLVKAQPKMTTHNEVWIAKALRAVAAAQHAKDMRMMGGWLKTKYHYKQILIGGIPENPPHSEGYTVKVSDREIARLLSGQTPEEACL